MTKEYFIFIDTDNKYNTTGADTTTNFYYHIGEILPKEFKKYHVELLDLVIPHLLDGNTVYAPYTENFYNIYINFNSSNISSNYSYVEIFTDIIPKVDRLVYWNVNTGAPEYITYLKETCIIGRNGPKIIINNPQPIINIKILNNTGGELMTAANVRPAGVKMLLKFTGIDEK